MAFSDLTRSDLKVAQQCIELVVDGPYLMPSEVQTRTGLTKAELEAARSALPGLTKVEADDRSSLAINNCLNEVVNGINIETSDWPRWFDVTPTEVADVLLRWQR